MCPTSKQASPDLAASVIRYRTNLSTARCYAFAAASLCGVLSIRANWVKEEEYLRFLAESQQLQDAEQPVVRQRGTDSAG
ncbi:hypothetical protein [Rubidibacter lacunae]|uniref:hypothetical protein n=1 Tax=Rubidibacter lacunae TaxID=582514 RepID=UPI00058B5A1B|nr:hypothetical protein [Rubidibacter lacunae]